MAKTIKPSQIRVGNWWFWQEPGTEFAVDLDDVAYIGKDVFSLKSDADGGYDLDPSQHAAMIQAMKDYQLWKATRSAEFAAFKAARVPTAPPAYMQGDTQP